jgi:hypothetical protein
MKRRGEMRVERRRMKGRRGEVERSSQGNEGDRMAIERRPEWGTSGWLAMSLNTGMHWL